MSEIWLEEHDRGWSLPIAITLGTINVVVVLGNIFVLYILITQKSLHTSTNYIVLSLTLADFLLGVIILPFSMIQVSLCKMQETIFIYPFFRNTIVSGYLTNYGVKFGWHWMYYLALHLFIIY